MADEKENSNITFNISINLFKTLTKTKVRCSGGDARAVEPS
jgi:hypothetical protein